MAETHLTGRALIKMNGETFRSRPGATFRPEGKSRTTQVGDDGVHGYTEALVAPRVEFTISHSQSTSLKKLNDITDASITFECDSGATYIVSPAWQVDDAPTLNAQDGTVALVFEGQKSEEL